MFSSLQSRNYRLFAAGQVVSNTGSWMQRVAQDWLVLELTHGSGAALGLVVTLQQQSFFPSGDDSIYESSYPALARVATVIAELPNPVQLEGHTDSLPIHTERFRNNWELSTARATAIARLLLQHRNINPADLSAAGYAEFHPVADNTTESGRTQNRRVDIILLRHPAASQ